MPRYYRCIVRLSIAYRIIVNQPGPVPKLPSNFYSINIIPLHFKRLMACKTIYQKSNHVMRESEPQKTLFLIRRFKPKSSRISQQPIIILKRFFIL
jgi:hypothetical protein